MIDAIFSRRSVRSFLTDAIPPEEVLTLLKAGFHAPSVMNKRPWHFVTLEGEKLAEVLDGVPNAPKGAPMAILVCVDGRSEHFPVSGDADAAAASQNILLAAESLGLGATWSVVLQDSVEHVRRSLGLPLQVRPYAVIPVGKPASKPAPVDRWDETKVHRNGW